MLQHRFSGQAALAPQAPLEGDRSVRARFVLLVLAAMTVVSAGAALHVGAFDAPTLPILMTWAGLDDGQGLREVDRIVILSVRLPRVIMGGMVGAALAMSGAVMQGLFRNPLADPGIVGVSAGASLGAVSIIVLGGTVFASYAGWAGSNALPFAAFLGGLASTYILYSIATRERRTSVATMLLAGIALGAFALAMTGLLIFVADDQQLRQISFWSLGSLAGATWEKVFSVLPIIAPSLAASVYLARGLNALAFGEAAAVHMGVSLQAVKNTAIFAIAAATGASVAVSGGIGFVGIIVPHVLRLLIGPDHRYLLPASGLLGAVFLIFADCISRTVVPPAELPIGIVTAAIGAPFFLWILLRRRGIIDL
ncbi:FecCD family ABC transporter permease [Pseudohoeflea coraliihabitans]|uniref:Iron ABC transporter permease n=1 Tax=Pseudohoeflea coraliihabitans TaxID=2860393 RepID=A0ABS6WQN1_9HYPH|nr:iron ABC transporter permease [Pseudohoeflea sp. DP4N28-3]MBW3097707.1 iron ABC transporter permease [Pseudohoeflea sp. DP4N28-3]